MRSVDYSRKTRILAATKKDATEDPPPSSDLSPFYQISCGSLPTFLDEPAAVNSHNNQRILTTSPSQVSRALNPLETTTASPFYCDTSILSTTLCERKQHQLEDRLLSQKKRQPIQLTSLPSTPQSSSDILSTLIKTRQSKGFDFLQLDRVSTALYNGETSSVKKAKDTCLQLSMKISATTPCRTTKVLKGSASLPIEGTPEMKTISINGLRKSKYQDIHVSSPSHEEIERIQNVESRTLSYENFMTKMIKKAEEIQKSIGRGKDGVQDNFIQVKLNKTQPVILGLSQNYRALHVVPQETAVQHDYKRHKMKQSQLLVRSAAKYIEQQRKIVESTTYGRSFDRLKDNMANMYSTDEQQGQELELKPYEANIVKTLTQRTKKVADQVQDQHQDRIKHRLNEEYHLDETYNSKQRMKREEEKRENIRKEITDAQERNERKQLKEQISQQGKRVKLLHRQSIMNWAKAHQLNDLPSMQKYSDLGNQEKKESGMNLGASLSTQGATNIRQGRSSSPQKEKVKSQDQKMDMESEEISADSIQFKSQQIMKKVIWMGRQHEKERMRKNSINRSKQSWPRQANNNNNDESLRDSQRNYTRKRVVSFSMENPEFGTKSMFETASQVVSSRKAASKLISLLHRNKQDNSEVAQPEAKQFFEELEEVIQDIHAGGYQR